MPAGPPPFPLVFVNRVYWPCEQATAQLLTDLAEGLAARGWPVTVITAGARAGPGGPLRPGTERRHGVDIIRLGPAGGRSTRLIPKAVGYLRYALALRRRLPRVLTADHGLIALTDPPFLTSLAARLARRRRARLVHLVYDIHPEVEVSLSSIPLLRWLVAPWMRSRDRAWCAADCCVVIGRDMASLLTGHGVPEGRIRVVPGWPPGGGPLAPVPADENALRREWNLEGRFVVGYSGNLGRVHALEPLVAAAARLRDLPDLVFVFIGNGPRRAELEATAARLRLANVRFFPPQPRTRLAESLSVADVHLVTLRAGCERCVYPSKLYGVLAVGRPVLFVGPPACDLARSVVSHEAGLVASDGDPEGIAAAIRTLQADPDRRLAQGRAALGWLRETGGLPSALASWDQLLRDTVVPQTNSRLP